MDKEISVEDVFSLRRPRDIRAGIASGLKSVAKGLVGGTVGLLAAPTVGAVQDGLPGFARGVAAGNKLESMRTSESVAACSHAHHSAHEMAAGSCMLNPTFSCMRPLPPAGPFWRRLTSSQTQQIAHDTISAGCTWNTQRAC